MKRLIIFASVFGILSSFILIEQVSAFPPSVGASPYGFSDHPADRGGMQSLGGHMIHLFRVMELLDLNQSQRVEIWAILDNNIPSMRTQMALFFSGRKQLRGLINNELDEARLEQLANIQGQNIAKIIILRAQTLSQIRSVLTPEQQSRLKEEFA